MTAHHLTSRLTRSALAVVLAVTAVLTPVVLAAPAAADDVVAVAVEGPTSETPRLGTTAAGGGEAESTCPAGSVLTGVDAVRTAPVAARTWLSSAVAVCTALTLTGDDATLGGPVPPAGALTGTDASGPASSSPCPEGSIATGLRGFGGALVDQVTLLCSPLSAGGALQPAGAAPAAGLQGGSAQGPFACPVGAVAVGLVGRVGEDLDQLGLRCQALLVASSSPQETNTSWATALLIGNNGPAVSNTIRSAGQDRWFRFPVTPGSRVQVDLTGLPADYDLTLFKDITTAFTTLTTPQDLHQLSAEFAADAYSPSAFSPSAFSPSAFSPSAFSPSAFSPSAFSPSAFSPSAFSPSAFSPSAFSPSAFSPDVFAEAFSSAQTRSLIAVSANDGTAPERISASTWNGTGHFYVRVQGRNGAASASPFTVRVTTEGGPCATVDLGDPGPVPAAQPVQDLRTVILTDSSRMSGTEEEQRRLSTSLEAFRAAVRGVVVDLGALSQTRVRTLNARADAATACPYAKNLVAQAAREIVNSYRSSPLQHVVVVGDDSVVPFFRYPDAAGLGPEEDYVPPVAETTASQASLRTNHVLGQDAYGALRDVSVKGATIPVPDLAVGRLVETPAEITAVLDRYVAGTRTLTPTSTLTTGYDFLTDAADEVSGQFRDGVPTGRHASLITDQDVPPSTTTVGGRPSRRASWTADDLRSALLGVDTSGQVGLPKHDMVFLAGHFSANSALAADYESTILSTELARAPAGHFADTLVFSAGCHSGYNIVDREGIPGVTAGLDWTQALVQKGATLVAGTGYQYGDTEFLEFSERLYAGFARELRTGDAPSIAVGAALARAKQEYLATTVSMRGIDTKSLLEATLYGLPMLGVDMAVRLPDPNPTSEVIASAVVSGPGGQLGLSAATVDLRPAPTPRSAVLDVAGSAPPSTVTATWLEGPDGVDANPAEPVLPVDRLDATVPGKALRGVVLRSATYTDTTGTTPLTGAPATESSNPHVPFASPVFFPGRLATPNAFDLLHGTGEGGRTRLHVTPVQHRSDAPGSLTSTRRAYSGLGFDLYYSGNTSSYTSAQGSTNVPALAAPPSISSVTATDESTVTFSARVVGDPSAGMQRVVVTYTGEPGSPWHGRWLSVDLKQDRVDSTLWTGTVEAGSQASSLRYLVQAVNGVGLVTLDDNRGAYFTPGRTAGQDTVTRTGTTLVLGTGGLSGATYGSLLPVSATLTGGGTASSPAGSLAGRRVVFTLGTSTVSATTNASGVASADLPVTTLPGASQLTASFAGDATHASSTSEPHPVTVARQPTSLVLTPPDSTGSVVATLTRTGGFPLRDKTVLVVARDTAGGVVAVLPVSTDPAGQAVVDARRLPLAAGTLRAYFSGVVPLPDGASSTLVDRVYAATTSQSVEVPAVVAAGVPTAVLGRAYDAQIATTTRPLTAIGLPPGITLVAGAQGWSLRGTPTAAGAYVVVLSSGSASVRLPVVVEYVTTAFRQPIDDPADATPSTFNVKSTVPVKLALTDAQGIAIPDAEAQALAAGCRVKVGLTRLGTTSASIDEPLVTGTGDTGPCMRYDATGDQFVYNGNRTNLSFAAGSRYRLTATVRAATGEPLGLRAVEIGFR